MQDYELRLVKSPEEWTTYHRIRRVVLYDSRGRAYDAGHPDDRHRDNRPLILLFRGRAVGTARLDCSAGSSLGVLRSVAIDEPEQRRGHGTKLINLVIELAQRLGLSVLDVNSAADAVAFYQRLGFQVIDGKRESPLLRRHLS